MLIDLVMLSAPKPPGSSTLVSPPAMVLEIAWQTIDARRPNPKRRKDGIAYPAAQLRPVPKGSVPRARRHLTERSLIAPGCRIRQPDGKEFTGFRRLVATSGAVLARPRAALGGQPFQRRCRAR